MAQHQETQLGSSVPEHEGMAFDGLSSSLKLNSSDKSVMVKREEGSGGGGGGGGVGLMRSCSECGKQFSSGKALGGHKRACLQSKNSRLKPKPAIKMEVAVDLDGDAEGSGKKSSNVDKVVGAGNCRCAVCDQSFMTMKSLYGHMRKHPDRQWRGIHPPQQQQQQQPMNHHRHHVSGSSTLSNDDDDRENDNDVDDVDDDDDDDDDDVDERAVAVDLVESLKGWSVKNKRGRKSSTSTDTARPSSNSVSKEEKEEKVEVDPVDKEAASNLFFLAQTLHKYEFGGQSKKWKLDQIDRCSGYGVLKIKEIRPETDHHAQESGMGIETDMLKKMKLQKKRKLTELEPNTYRFHCPICNKGFDKHQALGGHVASHNNKSKNLINSMKESSASVEEERQVTGAAEFDQEHSGGDDDRSSRVNGELGDHHQCNICRKNFPTGQALGGHKRCHWTGPSFPEAFSSSSQVTTSTGEVSQTPPRRVPGGLDIDLNDTPQEFYQFYGFPEPREEAEAVAGAGAGVGAGACSKDNSMR